MRRFSAGSPGVRASCAAVAVVVVTGGLAMGLTMVRAAAPASVPTPVTAVSPTAEVVAAVTPSVEVEAGAEAAGAGSEVAGADVAGADVAVSFDGRPLRKVESMRMRVTAYSPHAESCGEWADGITASGFSVWTNGGRMVAADTDLLPFGSIVSVPGYHDGEPVQVLDRGGAIKGKRLDVLYPTHQRALRWGVQHVEVTVWEYAD